MQILANGISIGTIGANSSRTVAFQVFVPTIPAVNPITNQSGTTFQYTYDPSKPAVMQMVASNTVQTTINNARSPLLNLQINSLLT